MHALFPCSLAGEVSLQHAALLRNNDQNMHTNHHIHQPEGEKPSVNSPAQTGDANPITRKMLAGPNLITKKIFAERTCLSVRSVENLLAQGKIPFIRFTRKLVRIPWDEAMEHLRSQYTINPR